MRRPTRRKKLMPRLSVADCKALLQVLEEHPVPSSYARRAAARLRQDLEQATVSKASANPAIESCTLHVCTSCRPPGTPREPRESRPGFKLYQALRAAFHESRLGHHVEVRPAQCLSLCPRPCGIALSSHGAWTYLFGDQRPGESAGDILECVSLYIDTENGLMPREQRPKTLRASVLGRVPPFDVQTPTHEPLLKED